MGLAMQKGNKVTLSYRKSSFSRIKERNTKRLQDASRSPQLRVIFDSVPVEITETHVVLDIKGSTQEIPNDFVWVFAGGVAPNEFLKKIGIQYGVHREQPLLWLDFGVKGPGCSDQLLAAAPALTTTASAESASLCACVSTEPSSASALIVSGSGWTCSSRYGNRGASSGKADADDGLTGGGAAGKTRIAA